MSARRATTGRRAVTARRAGRVGTSRPAHLPVSTYRLQLNASFGFHAATRVLPYLDRLGVTDVYASPLLAARPGSTHGYDVCDPTRLDPALGSTEVRDTFASTMAALGLRLLLDIVPNHMSADPASNPWWRDVVESGRSSRHARVFDVAWRAPTPSERSRIVLPVLGDSLDAVLSRGELRLALDAGRPVIEYFDRRFPVDPVTVLPAYEHALAGARRAGAARPRDLREMGSCIAALRRWAGRPPSRRGGVARAERDAAKQRLAVLLRESGSLRRHVRTALERIGRTRAPGVPPGDPLRRLLRRQAYRLACWRSAAREMSYRRFFDISDLVGVRVESPYVFRATHRLVLDLVRRGFVAGLRIDHIDGLRDPAGYLDRLQTAVRRVRPARQPPRAARHDGPPCYVVVEKILTGDEPLRADWATHGTTGYDFLNAVNGLLVRPEGEAPLRRAYEAFAGPREDFEVIAYESMRRIAETSMAGEIDSLERDLRGLARAEGLATRLSTAGLGMALREVVACFPVYRTYVGPTGAATADDSRAIERAISCARRRGEGVDVRALAFLRRVLLEASPATPRRLRFVQRLQQCTGPVRAKGVEDTALYRDHTLVSLNEVGGEPSQFGVSPAAFHAVTARRQRSWPWSMLTTATHDTKLGEDVRARVAVLSEVTDEWSAALERLASVCDPLRTRVDGRVCPDPNDEYRLLQVLVGSWPPDVLDAIDGRDPRVASWAERLARYAVKAAREAKHRTSWRSVDARYEAAYTAYVEELLGPAFGDVSRALRSVVAHVARAGALNSLAQVALKIGSPGVPDIYQGAELWDLALVDPDNRRPVDFRARARMLRTLEPRLSRPDGSVTDLLASWPDGRIKLYLTAAALRLRRSAPDVFLHGEYHGLEVCGGRGAPVAFVRRWRGDAALIVVGRHLARAAAPQGPLTVRPEIWGRTALDLPDGLVGRTLRNVLTGRVVTRARGRLPLARVMDGLPVAIMVVEPPAR